jgi:hypothetical protein
MTIKTFQIGFHKFDNAPNLFTMSTIAMSENLLICMELNITSKVQKHKQEGGKFKLGMQVVVV